MHELLVGTRKGLFVVRSEGGTWKLGAPAFVGEPVSQVAVDAKAGTWWAALRLGHFGVKLKRSSDRGASWEEVATPAFPPKPTEGPWKDDATPWTVDLLWALEAGPGRLWAGAMPAGLFVSEDRGASWRLVESLWYRPDRKDWFGGAQFGWTDLCVAPFVNRSDYYGLGPQAGSPLQKWLERLRQRPSVA